MNCKEVFALESIRQIKTRIISIKSTQKIIKAMNLISSVKLGKMKKQASESKLFPEQLLLTLGRLMSQSGLEDFTHPLLEKYPNKKIGYCIFSSDRGLCGGYNHAVFAAAEKHLSQQKQPVEIFALGKMAAQYFSKAGYEIRFEESGFYQDRIDYQHTRFLAREMQKLYSSGKYEKIYFVYNDFISVLKQEVRIYQALPLNALVASVSSTQEIDYFFDTPLLALAESMLQEYWDGLIYAVAIAAKTAEYASRMRAMDAASKNASEMLKDLQLRYNRIRQGLITSQIIEIAVAADLMLNED
ncbi:MAG: ATP synthase F1 subunit gamma [Clostridia bacterium]